MRAVLNIAVCCSGCMPFSILLFAARDACRFQYCCLLLGMRGVLNIAVCCSGCVASSLNQMNERVGAYLQCGADRYEGAMNGSVRVGRYE